MAEEHLEEALKFPDCPMEIKYRTPCSPWFDPDDNEFDGVEFEWTDTEEAIVLNMKVKIEDQERFGFMIDHGFKVVLNEATD